MSVVFSQSKGERGRQAAVLPKSLFNHHLSLPSSETSHISIHTTKYTYRPPYTSTLLWLQRIHEEVVIEAVKLLTRRGVRRHASIAMGGKHACSLKWLLMYPCSYGNDQERRIFSLAGHVWFHFLPSSRKGITRKHHGGRKRGFFCLWLYG